VGGAASVTVYSRNERRNWRRPSGGDGGVIVGVFKLSCEIVAVTFAQMEAVHFALRCCLLAMVMRGIAPQLRELREARSGPSGSGRATELSVMATQRQRPISELILVNYQVKSPLICPS